MLTTLTLATTLFGCTRNGSGGGSAPAPPVTKLAKGTVVAEAGGRNIRITVELAQTTPQRVRGLMYRRELPQSGGMLFIFDREEVQSFWMKNTYIPLDMVFIDSDKKVVGVVHNAEPLTETSRRVDAPSRYVLEVNGGFAKKHGIEAGTRVRFEGF